MHYKDQILDSLAERANVAQFASFAPPSQPRFSRVAGFPRNHQFNSIGVAARAILERAADRSVNIRSFEPADPKSREFVYGLRSADDIEANANRLLDQGLHIILNETIDIRDGGVSGVVLGDVIEFAPDDTPRSVEKPGAARFPRDFGLRLLHKVYGSRPNLDFPSGTRVEFSVHPIRRGVRQEHTIIWELEDVEATAITSGIRWPNRFSSHIGDKAFGLLVAHLMGFAVPHTTVIGRRVAPFSFGRSTGTSEPWLRTAPAIQQPGRFTTTRGWTDPFRLLREEDPSDAHIAGVLLQEGVDAQFSGAAIGAEGPDGPVITIEGTQGFGDEFMLGVKPRTALPRDVSRRVTALYHRAFKKSGYIRFEWVADYKRVWIVQFHVGPSVSQGTLIYPGDVSTYIDFEVRRGLEALREECDAALAGGFGITLVGDVGITSHFGDVLRKAKVPSRIQILPEG